MENTEAEDSTQHDNMDPISSYTIGAVAIGISNLWNGWRQRKQAAQFEEKRILEKRIADETAHCRAIEMQDRSHDYAKILQDRANKHARYLQSRAHSHEKELQQIGYSNDLKKNELDRHFSITNMWFERGGWKNTIRPNEMRPMIIFDTKLTNNTSNKDEFFAFNPMESLYHAFENQANRFMPGDVYVTNFRRGFESQSAAEAFYNDEMMDMPAIFIYGSYDGFLRIHAVYGGMTINQYSFDKNYNPLIIPYRPEHICLMEIPNSSVAGALDRASGISSNFLTKEQIQKELLDLVANSSLQALVDSHFSIHKKNFKPIVGRGQYLGQLEKLDIGIKTDSLKEAMKEHEANVQEQLKYIKSLHSEHTKDFLNNMN